MYRYIFFDLDGTLTDPQEGITKSVQYALAHMGIDEPELKKLLPFIGPPLIDSFREYYGMTLEEARRSVRYYREYFEKDGLYQNRLFDGVPELLSLLRDRGRVLSVASSKPEPFVLEILRHFGILDEFDYVCGSSMDETRTKKEEVLRELLERMELSDEDKENVLMVGDRRHDVEGARACGIACLGVSMGFAAKGELESAGAVAVVHSIREIGEYVLRP